MAPASASVTGQRTGSGMVPVGMYATSLNTKHLKIKELALVETAGLNESLQRESAYAGTRRVSESHNVTASRDRHGTGSISASSANTSTEDLLEFLSYPGRISSFVVS